MKKAEPSASPGQAGQRPLVLVVDDFEDNRAMYTQFLTFEGFRVEEAANGKEAVDKAMALGPDIIVMDLSLPVMDGWEATRQLKQNPRTRRIPVLALTGHALGAQSQKAREAGCDAFLTKPCLPEDLAVELRRMLAGAGKPKTGR